MEKNLRNRILLILGVIVAAILFGFPLDKRINLGLDLKGGMHLVLKVEIEKIAAGKQDDAVLRAIEILRNRIDSLGVGETLIQRQGQSDILVQLPGVTDRDTALAMIGKVALLEFRMVKSDPKLLQEAIAGNVPPGYILRYSKDDNQPLLLFDQVALKGERIKEAHVGFTKMSKPNISFALDDQGTKQFADLTRNHVDEELAIIVDDVVLSAPNINEPILGGTGEITGQFTFEEASQLALQLRSGALPAPMHVEEERTIGPLLGKDSIEAGINATRIGASLAFLFMVIYYIKAGFIADIALLINLLLIFGTMGFLNIMLPANQLTLTLPGIAGIVLTLGMAVDANVLINERIREEIRNGRTIVAAVEAGYHNAMRTIIDANVTTVISGIVLYQFGTGPIKGFAVTLILGLVISMYTACLCSRMVYDYFLTVKRVERISV